MTPRDPNGAYDFSQLDLGNIEKIEILEGPQSSIWGSDAIGGVISLTTREEDGWRAQGEGGTLDTIDGSLAAGKRTDTWAAGVSFSGFRTDGVSKADGFPERDPDNTWNVGGYGRVDLGQNVVVDGRIAYVDSLVHTDGYNALFEFGDTPEFATYQSWSGDLRAVIHDPWGFTQTLTLGGYSLDRAALGNDDPANNSRFTSARQDYRWTSERGAPTDRFGVIFGVERISDHGSISTGDTLEPRDDLRLRAGARAAGRPADADRLGALRRPRHLPGPGDRPRLGGAAAAGRLLGRRAPGARASRPRPSARSPATSASRAARRSG